jgi:hypothetical protein
MFSYFRYNRQKIGEFIKLTAISGGLFILLLIVILSLLAWLFKDNIRDGVISYINKGLQTEVFIDDISVNAFRKFPLIAISVKNVSIIETENVQSRDTLLKASNIYLSFSLFDFIRKKFNVRQAEIANGFVHMKLLEDGGNNYTFWKTPDQPPSGDSELAFQVKKLIFTNMGYQFHDLKRNYSFSLLLNNAQARGDFTQNNYLLALRGDMMVQSVMIDSAALFRDMPLVFDFKSNVENNNVFTFHEGDFLFASHAFKAEGVVDLSDTFTYLDLKVAASDLRFENVIKDLPEQYARYFSDFRSKGQFYFNAALKGNLGDVVNPYISATFGIDEGELIQRKGGQKLENISFDATFDNGTRRNITSTSLDLKGLSANLNDKSLRADVNIFNFDEPSLSVKMYSDINATDWQRFLQIKKIAQASGEMFVDIDFKGKLGESRNFTAYHFMASQVTGVVQTQNFSLALKNDPLNYHSVNADLLFNNNDILIQLLEGKASSSDFKLSGYFRNVLPWLFFENERLFVSANLSSKNLNFNELLQHSINESDTTYRLHLSEMIDFRLKADVENLAFKKFNASKVRGTLSMREQMFYANDISLQSMKGTILASGYINGKNADDLIMACETRIIDVDVYDLFYQMGNFGQQSIVYDNLRGRITADARFLSHWSPFLDVDWNKLEVTADVKVENGELINYKPMLALSRFIRVGDLNQVKFSTLENQITIKNQTIFIPDMEINSNAINIKLSGEHTFENQIDYRLQVLLSDLLARKNRESRNPQEQYGDIIDDGLGRTTLFLRVTGDIDNPVFRYDTRAVRDKLRDDFRQEGQNLRQAIRTEFGLNQSDTMPDGTPVQPTEREKQKEEIEKGEKGKFIIEWD